MGCSSSTHTWDAFQLAHAASRLHCARSNYALPGDDDIISCNLEPQLIGEPLKISVEPPEIDAGEDEDDSLGTLPAISIHDNNVTMRFLICGVPCTPVSSFQLFVLYLCAIGYACMLVCRNKYLFNYKLFYMVFLIVFMLSRMRAY